MGNQGHQRGPADHAPARHALTNRQVRQRLPATRQSLTLDGASTPRELLDGAVRILAAAAVAEPRLDAELLLAHASGRTRAAILSGGLEVDGALRARFAALIARRARREPLAYLTGEREFYSLALEVTPAVLIPRPETELVVERALVWLARRAPGRVLDLGTGSGAIAIAIAAHAEAAVVATDVSAEALTVARRNVVRHGLQERIALRRADVFTALDGGPPLERFDLIVSNPPYISERELPRLQPEIRCYEPRQALAGGDDGLKFYRLLAAGLRDHSSAGGCVIVEIGAGQAAAAAELFQEEGWRAIESARDLSGIIRVLVVTR